MLGCRALPWVGAAALTGLLSCCDSTGEGAVDAAMDGDGQAARDAGPTSAPPPGGRTPQEECRPYYGGPLELDGYGDDFSRVGEQVSRPDVALVFEPPTDAVYVANVLSDDPDIEVWVLRGRCQGPALDDSLDDLVLPPGAQFHGLAAQPYTLVVEIPPRATWMQLVLAGYCEESVASCVVDAGRGLRCGIPATVDARPGCEPL